MRRVESEGELQTPRTLIGGVGYWWQRDASFGVVAAQALANESWPAGIEVADLGYGALFVVQDLAAADPPYDRLILITSVERGRRPGGLYRREPSRQLPDPDEIQARIREAGAGVVDIDHLLIIASYFKALPEDVLVFELEPVDVESGAEMTSQAEARVKDVSRRIRRELNVEPAEML